MATAQPATGSAPQVRQPHRSALGTYRRFRNPDEERLLVENSKSEIYSVLKGMPPDLYNRNPPFNPGYAPAH